MGQTLTYNPTAIQTYILSLVDISRLQVVRFKCSLIIPLTYLLIYAGFDRKSLKQLPLWY